MPRGKQVKDLRHLHNLALARRAVTGNHPMFGVRYLPAAFVVSMQGRAIISILKRGLYEYEKEKPTI